jgi:WD40 repeat protein
MSVASIVAFSPNNRWLAYATTNHDVILWDLAAKREKATLKAHRWWLMSLGFSPDGKWLATGGQDGEVWLWSVDTAKPRFSASLAGHMGLVLVVVFSSDSRTLATIGRDQTMRWWSVATGREMVSFHSQQFWSSGFLDYPAPGNSSGRLLLLYEQPGQVRVTTLPSLAEIDAAESQQPKDAQPH